MNVILGFLFFNTGLVLGSFFNVVGLRLPLGKTFGEANDRSYCPHCKTRLSWYELIPLFSFLAQRALCRHCKNKISFLYPVVECLTGFLFAFSFVKIGLEWELLTALLFISMLMIILVTDLKYMLIPNRILLFFLSLIIIMRIIQPLNPWWSSVIGAVLGFGIIFIVILISRGGMGAGDMKLFGVLGIVLGAEGVLLSFFLACFIGAVIGGLLLAFNIIKRRQPVPFGPYIVFAALIAYFYGDSIIYWYTNILIG